MPTGDTTAAPVRILPFLLTRLHSPDGQQTIPQQLPVRILPFLLTRLHSPDCQQAIPQQIPVRIIPFLLTRFHSPDCQQAIPQQIPVRILPFLLTRFHSPDGQQAIPQQIPVIILQFLLNRFYHSYYPINLAQRFHSPDGQQAIPQQIPVTVSLRSAHHVQQEIVSFLCCVTQQPLFPIQKLFLFENRTLFSGISHFHNHAHSKVLLMVTTTVFIMRLYFGSFKVIFGLLHPKYHVYKAQTGFKNKSASLLMIWNHVMLKISSG